jgi:hypothetical protein
MSNEITPAFGDNVIIRDTPATQAAGFAGRTGTVSGFTTPSVTAVDVFGATGDDFALAVMFDDDSLPDTWFAKELVLFIDHAPGTEIRVGNVKAVRAADGTWIETRVDGSPQGSPLEPAEHTKPWWKLW